MDVTLAQIGFFPGGNQFKSNAAVMQFRILRSVGSDVAWSRILAVDVGELPVFDGRIVDTLT